MRSLSHISNLFCSWSILTVVIIFVTVNQGFSIENRNLNLNPGRKIEVPFGYYNGLIQLNVKLNGIPLSFIYDTGAEHSILTNKEVAILLELRIVKEIDVFGADLVKQMTAYVTEPLVIELFDTRIIKQK